MADRVGELGGFLGFLREPPPPPPPPLPDLASTHQTGQLTQLFLGVHEWLVMFPTCPTHLILKWVWFNQKGVCSEVKDWYVYSVVPTGEPR